MSAVIDKDCSFGKEGRHTKCCFRDIREKERDPRCFQGEEDGEEN
jgi:hypothetical protein